MQINLLGLIFYMTVHIHTYQSKLEFIMVITYKKRTVKDSNSVFKEKQGSRSRL